MLGEQKKLEARKMPVKRSDSHTSAARIVIRMKLHGGVAGTILGEMNAGDVSGAGASGSAGCRPGMSEE